MEKVGANEPCPCGSGVKYKRCCAANQAPQAKSAVPLIAGGVALLGVSAFAVWANFRSEEPTKAVAPVALAAQQQSAAVPAGAPAAQSPVTGTNAAAPAPTAAVTTTPAPAANGAPYPQPAGAVPPGKVWSPEHGHWHNAVATGVPASVPFPTPAARPIATPDGRVWSEEHKHWHDATANGGVSDVRVFGQPLRADGTLPVTPQPPGPAPAGKVWSAEHGHWHDVAKTGDANAKAAAPAAPEPEVKQEDVAPEVKQ